MNVHRRAVHVGRAVIVPGANSVIVRGTRIMPGANSCHRTLRTVGTVTHPRTMVAIVTRTVTHALIMVAVVTRTVTHVLMVITGAVIYRTGIAGSRCRV